MVARQVRVESGIGDGGPYQPQYAGDAGGFDQRGGMVDGLGVGRPEPEVSHGSFVVSDPITAVQGLAALESLMQPGDGEAGVGDGTDAPAEQVVGGREAVGEGEDLVAGLQQSGRDRMSRVGPGSCVSANLMTKV